MRVQEHRGHRERMKEKLLQTGLEKFAEHEMLELLLYFGIPFKDTNIIAHNLLKKFGSFSSVLEASVEDIMKVKGMTKNAAILLHFLPDFFASTERIN